MIYQFKIQLKKVSKPTVWRRVQVKGDHSLDVFHEIIQACFGWENYHSYQFSPKGWGSYPVYSRDNEPEEEFEGLEEDSREYRIKDVFKSVDQKMIYIYDFGDDWQHLITLENIAEGSLKEPFLVDGKGSCPPEDCGGPYMYSAMISNGDFEPEDFDLEEARANLSDAYNELD
jgi:hypothetical protein